MTTGQNLWVADWLWSLPLIAFCVAIHVVGLALINDRVVRFLHKAIDDRHFVRLFAVVIGAVALLATALHGVEASLWALAYWLLDALPDFRSAMLYSLSAMTTYGHSNISLEPQWQFMGALESLCGMLLFGLTTAFLFAAIQKVWPLGSRDRRP
ncbi:MAG: hypothetical protein R3C69_13370 [Geminicoccaceae bacterium]